MVPRGPPHTLAHWSWCEEGIKRQMLSFPFSRALYLLKGEMTPVTSSQAGHLAPTPITFLSIPHRVKAEAKIVEKGETVKDGRRNGEGRKKQNDRNSCALADLCWSVPHCSLWTLSFTRGDQFRMRGSTGYEEVGWRGLSRTSWELQRKSLHSWTNCLFSLQPCEASSICTCASSRSSGSSELASLVLWRYHSWAPWCQIGLRPSQKPAISGPPSAASTHLPALEQTQAFRLAHLPIGAQL